MKNILIIIGTTFLAGLFIGGCKSSDSKDVTRASINPGIVTKPAIPFRPLNYICYRGDSISVDGLLNENAWASAQWSEYFTDIEGTLKPDPLHPTRFKMLWDDDFLYIAAEIYEPHIWAYLKQRDTVIFYDNDFEIFIDPDDDTHGYYEFEINAANTVWDLLLTKPYRDNGVVLNAWNINGMLSAVKVYGTINDPRDRDDRWVVELAFPFSVLNEWGRKPADKQQWRINFSRVNWQTDIINGKYIKKTDPSTGKTKPEYNWVWSPQGVINMHYPEMWGYLQFSETRAGEGEALFVTDPDSELKWILRTLYYAQTVYATKNGFYSDNTDSLKSVGLEAGSTDPEIILTYTGYEASLMSAKTGNRWVIDESGKLVSAGNK